MRGIDATFDGVSFGRERPAVKVLPQFIIGVAALALMGSVVGYITLSWLTATPDVSMREPARSSTPPAEKSEAASNLFGEIVIEPGWGPKTAAQGDSLPLPRLEALPQTASAPVSQPDAAPPPSINAAPSAASIVPGNVPLPPIRDVARIDDSFPLPPPRPPGFGEPAGRPEAVDRRVAEPNVQPAPGGPNLIQRLLGLARPPSGITVASAPPAPPAHVASPRTDASSVAAAPVAGTGTSSQLQQGRGGGSGLFALFSPRPNFDRFGYDQYTAVYDISARTVYLPDGTRLEAHSGLGDKLDDPRYVSERMRGPTPPHLYELAMREASFHGVQALRLNPVGEGGLYGRAGLLAHPYMLGPNGDSNGCVSVKDYEAFLRAYENGQIKRLAVVARM